MQRSRPRSKSDLQTVGAGCPKRQVVSGQPVISSGICSPRDFPLARGRPFLRWACGDDGLRLAVVGTAAVLSVCETEAVRPDCPASTVSFLRTFISSRYVGVVEPAFQIRNSRRRRRRRRRRSPMLALPETTTHSRRLTAIDRVESAAAAAAAAFAGPGAPPSGNQTSTFLPSPALIF